MWHAETWAKHVSVFSCAVRWQHSMATPSGALLSALVTFLFHPETFLFPSLTLVLTLLNDECRCCYNFVWHRACCTSRL